MHNKEAGQEKNVKMTESFDSSHQWIVPEVCLTKYAPVFRIAPKMKQA
jgi:hypothetical protein